MDEDGRKIALFDMDNTLFDYSGTLRADMRKLMSPAEEEAADLYDESKPYLRARMDLIKSVPGWWRNLPPLTLGWDVLDVFRGNYNNDFKIKILTKGPNSKPLAWAEKAQCIFDHFGHTIRPDIVGEDKMGQYGHVLVEDYPPYILGWLKWRPRGLVILIHNDTNADFTHPNVLRYDGTNITQVNQHIAAVKARPDGAHWRDYL